MILSPMRKTIEILAWISGVIGKPPGWERIVRLIAPTERCGDIGDICLMRDGVMFMAQPSVALGWNVALFGTYEPYLRDIIRAVLPAGGVALDIGANVGWHTLLMARSAGASGRILAAEANPSVRERLDGNLKLNRFRQVEVIPYAVAAREGSAEFWGPAADAAGSGDGHMVPDGTPGLKGVIRVETRSVDSICERALVERVDLIKIDVEGYEWPVLQGAETTIAKFRPHIVFEYNAEYAARGGGDVKLLAAFFEKHRYRLSAIGRNWAEAVRPGRWPSCADIWAVPD